MIVYPREDKMANEHAIQATGTFVVSKGFRLLTKLAASQGKSAVHTGCRRDR